MQCLEYAEKLGVVIVKKKVKTIVPGPAIMLEDATYKIATDIVFDCTGKKRVIINEVNKLSPTIPIFHFKPIKNPNTHYVFVRVRMKTDVWNSYLKDPNEFQHADYTTVFHATKMAEMRLRFGWMECAPPFIYANPLNDSQTEFNAYTEAPKELKTVEQQIDWFQCVFQFKVGSNDVSFQVVENKPPFVTHFEVNPHHVTPECYLSSSKYPIVFHESDATIDAHFRKAHGVINSSERADALTEAMTFKEGKIIKIDLAQYRKSLPNLIQKHIDELEENFTATRARFANGYKIQTILYKNALLACVDSKTQNFIKQDLERMTALHEGMECFDKAAMILQNISDAKTGFAINNYDIHDTINACFALLTEAADLVPKAQTEARTNVTTTLVDFTRHCKQLGNHLFQLQNYGLARKYYDYTLQLITKYMTSDQADEIIELYLNLMIIAKKNSEFDQILHFADKGFALLPKVSQANRDKFAAKIAYQKAGALLHKSSKMLEEKDYDKSVLNKFAQEIERMIAALAQNTYANGAETQALKKQLDELNNKMNHNVTPAFAASAATARQA